MIGESTIEKFVGLWPREFAARTPKGFVRNIVVRSAREAADLCRKYHLTDCFLSVCSFTREKGGKWDRHSAVIDRLFFDFDSPSIANAARDALKLVRFAEKMGLTPLILFSGSKGFHVYLPVPPTPVSQYENPDTLLKHVCEYIAGDLSTYDSGTSDLARVARVPWTVNSKSGQYAVPVDKEGLKLAAEHGVIPPSAEIPEWRQVSEKWTKWILALFAKVDREITEARKRPAPASQVKHPEITGRPDVNYDPSDPIQARIAGAKGERWKRQRAINYCAIMKRYGSLWKSKHVRKNHGNEYEANAHFVLLLIELGLSDGEIHEIFQHYRRYDPKTTQYYIDYFRKKSGQPAAGLHKRDYIVPECVS